MTNNELNITDLANTILGSYLLTDILVYPELRTDLFREIDRCIADEQALFCGKLRSRPKHSDTRIATRLQTRLAASARRALMLNSEIKKNLFQEIDRRIEQERVLFERLTQRERTKKIVSAQVRHKNGSTRRPKNKNPYSKYADITLYNKVRKLAREGQEIPEQLHAELKRRNSNYNQETAGFSHPHGFKRQMNTDYTKSSTPSLTNSARSRMKRGTPIPQQMMDELRKRGYIVNEKSGTVKNIGVPRPVDDTATDSLPQPKKRTRRTTKSMHRNSLKNLHSSVTLRPMSTSPINMRPVRDSAFTSTQTIEIAPQRPLAADAYDGKTILNVAVIPNAKKHTNRITVDGVTILDRHRDTQLRILLGGQLLGIFGVQRGATEPSWTIFNTKLKQIPGTLANDPTLTIRQVYDLGTVTRITMATKTNLEYQYAYNQARKSAFKIVEENMEKTK